jgi:hypothetical protein
VDFFLHDVSQFPFVALKSERCPPGFAEQWGIEMSALLDSNRLFVVAFEPGALNETAEDFRTRGIWFKKNRQLLPGRCAAMIAVVPDEQVRKDNAVDMAKRSKGFEVLYAAMESFQAAAQATDTLLADAQDHFGKPAVSRR